MKHNLKNESPKTSWNEVSDWYDKLVRDAGSDYHQNVIIPNALKLLDPQKGEKILDVGCGQGVFCRELAKSGADVIGSDSSKNLIKIAKTRSANIPNIKYIVADAAKMKMFQDETFDAVTCIMAIQNMDPLEKAVSEISRVLKNGGRILFVTSHPCFRLPKQSEWGFDKKKNIQYRRIDKYMSPFKAPIKMHPGYAPDQITYTFHRPVSYYFDVLGEHSFFVLKLEEWISHRISKPGTRQKAENQARDEIPMFLAVLARKLSTNIKRINE